MAFATNCSIVLVVLLCWYEKEAKAQDNPCPRLLHVEPRKTNEPDKWYATVTLISDADLSGVWLRLIFDRPSLQLGVSGFFWDQLHKYGPFYCASVAEMILSAG